MALGSSAEANNGQERPSGVPPPGRLGASRNELLALFLAMLVFAAIVVGFWFESTR
jgi:hypothetical protein